MFISGGQACYTRSGEQRSRLGDFLILVSCDELPLGSDNFRACVVRTHLEQFGCWMMGRCKVRGTEVVLSGSYGSDGLTKSVSRDIFDVCVPVPSELFEAWNKGGGWNSCGDESVAMRRWARENLKALRKAVRGKRVLEKVLTEA